jgi:thiol-disulfide isomerase/thioredoxin
MKDKHIIIIFVFITSVFSAGMAQTADTAHNNKNMVIGETTLEKLSQNTEFWNEYRKNYDNYSIDEKKIEKISNILDSTKYESIIITAVIGTWCGDTKEQFPIFQKILDFLRFDNIRIKYIGVNRDKLAEGTSVSSLGIEFVPTFIFYRIENIIGNYQEIGRIVEIPEGTMEEHILKILSGKK